MPCGCHPLPTGLHLCGVLTKIPHLRSNHEGGRQTNSVGRQSAEPSAFCTQPCRGVKNKERLKTTHTSKRGQAHACMGQGRRGFPGVCIWTRSVAHQAAVWWEGTAGQGGGRQLPCCLVSPAFVCPPCSAQSQPLEAPKLVLDEAARPSEPQPTTLPHPHLLLKPSSSPQTKRRVFGHSGEKSCCRAAGVGAKVPRAECRGQVAAW